MNNLTQMYYKPQMIYMIKFNEKLYDKMYIDGKKYKNMFLTFCCHDTMPNPTQRCNRNVDLLHFLFRLYPKSNSIFTMPYFCYNLHEHFKITWNNERVSSRSKT